LTAGEVDQKLECPQTAVADFDVTSMTNLDGGRIKEVNLLWCHLTAMYLITFSVLWVRTDSMLTSYGTCLVGHSDLMTGEVNLLWCHLTAMYLITFAVLWVHTHSTFR
jgi:hypothetical protein